MAKASSTGMVAHARKVLAHQQTQLDDHDAAPDPDTAVVVAADTAFAAMSGRFSVVKPVAVPPLAFPLGATYVLKLREPIHVSEIEDSKFGPANVVTVEAMNGETRILIVTEVMGTALARAYPDGDYVGKWFQITKTAMKQGKRGQYADYAIAEIDVTN